VTGSRKPASELYLWLVLDEKAAAPRTLQYVTERALDGGVDAVVLRMIGATRRRMVEQARTLVGTCRTYSAPLIVSHMPGVAMDVGADGVHLGEADPSIEEVRALVGEGMLIGYSGHSVEETLEAQRRGADYVFLGHAFETPSHAGQPPLGLAAVSRAVAALRIPVVFIGGIEVGNVAALKEAGGRRIAAIRALNSGDDIAAQARALKAALTA
jgi:thiamine-phosphate diphosphorylase